MILGENGMRLSPPIAAPRNTPPIGPMTVAARDRLPEGCLRAADMAVR
jgi:hypothetical protein